MKKKLISVLILVILLVSCILLLIHAEDVIKIVLFAFQIWKNNLVPALFPFFVLSEFFIQYGFVDFLGELCRKFMSNIFHLPGECAFVLAMSMVSGFPSGAKYTKALVQEKTISEEEGTRLLTFTHFSNPLFIIGTLAITFLHNKKLGFLILISHYLVNFIIGILFRPKEKILSNEKTSLKKALSLIHKKRMNNSLSFGQILTKAVRNALDVLFLMFGIVTFFLIITTLIKEIIPMNSFQQTFISGFLEMTQGIKSVSTLSLSSLSKGMLMTLFLSFGGLSVHMQVLSIISDTKIRYGPFLVARLLHGGLASLLFLCLFLITQAH